jgi:outer membrane protein assembly factor BamB
VIARVAVAIACAAALAACGGSAAHSSSYPPARALASATGVPDGDWATFDYDPARSGDGPAATGITAANARGLGRRVLRIDGVADSAPIQIHAVRARGRTRDVVVVTTTSGHTIALDPGTGQQLWEFVPARSAEITTASPVLDPDRRYLYAASPDGLIHKLSVATGRQVWKARITFDPTREKVEGALNISGRYVIAATGGYFGDAPTYEGHVALIDRTNGRVAHVWNADCSYLHHLIDRPSACRADTSFGGSAIWGRPGVVVVPGSGRLLIATGNGPFNGATNWGDSVIELTPDAGAVLHSWTPANQSQLDSSDSDLGSTEPALLPGGLELQGGKSGTLALIDIERQGTGKTGGALQTLPSPGRAQLLSTPAVWHDLVFVADDSGTAAYRLDAGRLHVAWQDPSPGTSPILAGGLLYVYDQAGGTLRVLQPSSGRQVASLPAAAGHWSSPIVVGGRVVLPVGGSTSDKDASGTVFVYHLPGR